MIEYRQHTSLDKAYLRRKLTEFMAEDCPDGDKTSLGTISKNAEVRAEIQAVEKLVFTGGPVVEVCFEDLASVQMHVQDGIKANPGQTISTISGNAIDILTHERVMLNLIQRMSGIATNVKRFSDLAKPHHVKILDTRKTTPGLREFEKYAITVGGGYNHRFSLSDGILIKDNHIQAAGGVKPAITQIKESQFGLPIECEVDTYDQIHEALEIGVDGFLLDNMTPEQTREAVRIIRNAPNGEDIFIESSGGMNFDSFQSYLDTGINAISIGSLTHSVKSSDIRLEFKPI